MRKDAEDLLLVLMHALAGGERGAEAALVAREDALDVLPPVVDAPREAAAHGAPVARPGPAPARATLVEPDHRARHAQRLAAVHVIPLAVEARVGDHRA